MVDGDARAIFIDESGNAETSLVLTAIELPLAMVPAARARTSALIHDLRQLLPAFALVDELHAHRLARPLTPTEAQNLAGAPPFRTHEREFAYQHALHHLSDLPGARTYTAIWRWKGPFKPKGMSGGRRYRDLLAQVLDWVCEDPAPVAHVVIDHGGQEPWYRKALVTAQERYIQDWTVDMPASHDDDLVQLADLAAFAGYQSTIPGKPGSHPTMAPWYRTALASTFADGGNGYGYRLYEGTPEPTRKN